MNNVRWVWTHVRKARGMLAVAVILMAVEAFSNLWSVALQQTMIDDVFIGGQSQRFWPVLIQICIAYLVYSLLFTFGPHVIHRTVAKLRLSMGEQLIQRMFRIPTGTLQKERTADYVYRLTHDLSACANFGGQDVPRLAQQLTTAATIAAILAGASPYMLLAIVCFSIVYIALGRRFGPLRKKASAEVSRTRSALLVHLEEGVSSTREVIAFHRASWEARLYRTKFGEVFASVMAEGKLINKQLLVSDPLKWGALLFVLGFGGYLVMERQLSIGTFVVAVQFTTRMMDALSGLYHFAMETSSKLASVERIRNVLDGEGIREGDETLSGPVHTVRFDDVSFRYGERPVLNGIDLELAAGQKIALVGASGSGKSTIASVLARFFDADRGVVSANGVPISDLRREEWMRRVTVVFQDPYLFPDTIRSNLLLGRDDITEERMVEACEAMMIHDFFRELPDGYDTVIGERGVTLSGGQRQRLALARAVLRDPEILILDEATSSLDLETERRIQANLDRLRRGRMTIVIAHRLSTVRNADRIFVIGDGKVAEAGTHEELLQRDSVYRTLVLKEDRNEEGQLSPAY